ncbi:hypothetical protein VPH35_058396 [Triticum aestivum]
MAAELVLQLGEIEELVEEILIRLPKDEQGNILRSFLVCKPWRDLLAGDGFRRRYGDFHRSPPMLGFFHIWPEPCVEFIPTTDFDVRDLEPQHHYSMEDCRHGCVLLRYIDEDENIPLLVVWDPMTGSETLLGSLEKLGTGSWSALVLCAADNCRHGDSDCQSSPFRVVFVFLHHEEEVTTACVYSSETASWSSLAITDLGMFEEEIDCCTPSVLAGDTLYFLLFRDQAIEGCSILKYNLGTSCLSEIHLSEEMQDAINSPILIASDDGRLGLADLEVDPDGVASWAEHREIDLETLLPDGDFKISPELVGSIEGTDIIFATTSLGTYEIDLKSLTSPLKMLSSRLNQDPYVKWTILPYVSFYYPPAVAGIVDEESSEDGHGNEEA